MNFISACKQGFYQVPAVLNSKTRDEGCFCQMFAQDNTDFPESEFASGVLDARHDRAPDWILRGSIVRNNLFYFMHQLSR